jgi:hypothetical protein
MAYPVNNLSLLGLMRNATEVSAACAAGEPLLVEAVPYGREAIFCDRYIVQQ